jgi:hypothetical protein
MIHESAIHAVDMHDGGQVRRVRTDTNRLTDRISLQALIRKTESGNYSRCRSGNGNPDQYRFDTLHAAPMVP